MNPEASWALSALCVLVAAVVRGLTGFGFAAIAVVGLAMLGSLQQAVPLVLFLEVLSSLMLLRSALGEAITRCSNACCWPPRAECRAVSGC